MGGWLPFTEAMEWAMALALALILCDWVTGTAKGAKQHELCSSTMREGLWHKAGEVAVMVLAYMLEVGSAHIDLGFTVPLFVPTCVYIVFNETSSILENISVLNPELADTRLMQFFKSTKAADGKGGE